MNGLTCPIEVLVDWLDIPAPELRVRAFYLSRSRPGMGSFGMRWNPYECRWNAEISFANGERFCGADPDINEAMRKMLEAFPVPADAAKEGSDG